MTTTSHPTSPTGLRAFAARRPVTSYLVASFVLGWAFLLPPALLGSDLLQLMILPTAVLAQFGVALAVTALGSGRDGARALLRRTFRWRAHPVWYAVAVLALPVLAVAGATAALGPRVLETVVAQPAAVLPFVTGLGLVLLVNLWEETGWAAFVQDRLEARHGALAGAAVTGVLFALYHLPLQLGGSFTDAAIGMGVLLAVAVPFRIVVGRLYAATGGSVPVVALFQASFNVATSSVLFDAIVPGVGALGVTIAALVAAAAALTAVVRR
jgi:membrane protease YdiL (CAAX protease family)